MKIEKSCEKKKCEDVINKNLLTDEEKERKIRIEQLVSSEFIIYNSLIIMDKFFKFLDNKNLCVKKCVNPNHNHSINKDNSDDKNDCIMNDCYTCICTQPKCKGLWIITHKKTNISFAVGNECIHRFSKYLGDENEKFQEYYNAIKCSSCQCELFYNNNNLLYGTQNTNELFKDSDKNPYCFSCYKLRYINTQEVLDSFNDKNNIDEIVKYILREYKCKYCKVAMYFKTTSHHIANSFISNKDICKTCIEKEKYENERLILKNKLDEEIEKKLKEQIVEYQKIREQKKNDEIIQFKKNRIIRKPGFDNKDYNYTAQCKKCNMIYDYINSQNND